jgi:hypothetical protein
LRAEFYDLGFDVAYTTTTGDTPAAVGNRIAAAMIAFGLADGSNQQANYADPSYTPVNAPMIVKNPGTTLVDPNRWQPLALETTNVTFPNPPFERGVGNTMRPIEWNIKNPNIYMWNLNVQHQLPAQFLLTLGYAGTRGVHLWRNTDINTPEPARLADGTLFWAAGLPRPNRSFSTIELKKSDGNSWYNAGIFEIRKRWSHGFNFQSSYTFSRNIDTTQSSTFFSDATNSMISAMPEYSGFSYNKGLADFHAKHNWLLNFAWEVPFAKNLTGVSRAILDGWQLAGIHNLRSGSPMTLFVQANRSRSQWNPSIGPGLGLDRPSMVPGFTHESAIIGSPDQWFNPAAFRLQPAGTFGDLARGALIGPNLRAFDASAMKNFRWSKLGEGGAIPGTVHEWTRAAIARLSLKLRPGRRGELWRGTCTSITRTRCSQLF